MNWLYWFRQLVVAHRGTSYIEDDMQFIKASLRAMMPNEDFEDVLNIPITLGLGVTHHLLAHNAVKGGAHLEKLGRYDKFQAELLAEFITKLADTPEGDGTMLDNTMVLYGSSNSQTHVNTDYPLMLMGGEKLGIRQGAFHDFGKNAPPLSNLYLTLLNALNVPAQKFSDSSGTIAKILS